MEGRIVKVCAVTVSLCSVMFAAVAALGQESISVPRHPTRRVTDRPDVIGPKTQDALESKLETFGSETGIQIVVWIGSTLPEGVTIEEYANASFNLWGLGQKGKNNGVLLMLFIKSRKMRIETGDGVRDRLTDARAAGILAAMREPLRAKEYNRAVTEATDAMIEALRPPPPPPAAPQPLQSPVHTTTPPIPREVGAMMISSLILGLLCIGATLLCGFYLLRAIVNGFSRGWQSGGGGTNGVTVTHNHYRRGWGWGSRWSGGSSPSQTTIVHNVVDTPSVTSSSSSDDNSGSSDSGGTSGGGFRGGGSSSGGGASDSW